MPYFFDLSGGRFSPMLVVDKLDAEKLDALFDRGYHFSEKNGVIPAYRMDHGVRVALECELESGRTSRIYATLCIAEGEAEIPIADGHFSWKRARVVSVGNS